MMMGRASTCARTSTWTSSRLLLFCLARITSASHSCSHWWSSSSKPSNLLRVAICTCQRCLNTIPLIPSIVWCSARRSTFARSWKPARASESAWRRQSPSASVSSGYSRASAAPCAHQLMSPRSCSEACMAQSSTASSGAPPCPRGRPKVPRLWSPLKNAGRSCWALSASSRAAPRSCASAGRALENVRLSAARCP